jgi:hypothetical protein
MYADPTPAKERHSHAVKQEEREEVEPVIKPRKDP